MPSLSGGSHLCRSREPCEECARRQGLAQGGVGGTGAGLRDPSQRHTDDLVKRPVRTRQRRPPQVLVPAVGGSLATSSSGCTPPSSSSPLQEGGRAQPCLGPQDWWGCRRRRGRRRQGRCPWRPWSWAKSCADLNLHVGAHPSKAPASLSKTDQTGGQGAQQCVWAARLGWSLGGSKRSRESG